MMSEETLNGLATSLKISAAYIHQAASFYHYSNLGKDHILREGACGGPACCLPGVGVGRGTPGEGIACPGLCDQAPASALRWRCVPRDTTADPFLTPSAACGQRRRRGGGPLPRHPYARPPHP